jgi:hypothetical protein
LLVTTFSILFLNVFNLQGNDASKQWIILYAYISGRI